MEKKSVDHFQRFEGRCDATLSAGRNVVITAQIQESHTSGRIFDERV
jgi:hypothetical protein